MRGPATANAPCQQMKSKSLYLSIDHIQHGLLSGFLDSGRTCREPRFVLGFFFYTFFVLGHVCSVADPGIPKRGCGTWGLGPSSQKLWTLCYIHNSQQAKTSIKRHIQHDKNRTNVAQEIKLVWSSQNELVNDFDRFGWRRLRMYVE